MEVILTDQSVEAHIYESYWAPLREGQISFLQTKYYAALRREKAGKNDTRKEQGSGNIPNPKNTDDGLKHFDRRMFGKFHNMPIKPYTFWLLLATASPNGDPPNGHFSVSWPKIWRFAESLEAGLGSAGRDS